jgi:transporter family-2 protein
MYMIMVWLAGLLIPLQVLINSRLSSHLTGVLSATVVNTFIALLSVIVAFFGLGQTVPSSVQAGNAPWWAWTGGIFGAYFLTATALSIPKLGAAGTISLVIGGQLIASLILDHFGVLQATQPLTLPRLAGGCFLILGVYLILRPAA